MRTTMILMMRRKMKMMRPNDIFTLWGGISAFCRSSSFIGECANGTGYAYGRRDARIDPNIGIGAGWGHTIIGWCTDGGHGLGESRALDSKGNYYFVGGDILSLGAINGYPVRLIDGEATLVTHDRDNVMQGFIVQRNFELQPCYVVRQGDVHAHGRTLRQAKDALEDKLLFDTPPEERIAEFVEHFPDYDTPYPNKELDLWHHKLTGSCQMGRDVFREEHHISLDDSMTVKEFIRLTINEYQGSIIAMLKEKYEPTVFAHRIYFP